VHVQPEQVSDAVRKNTLVSPLSIAGRLVQP
jgi:hypothetical protein